MDRTDGWSDGRGWRQLRPAAGTHPPPSRGPARGSGFVRPRGGAFVLKPRAGPAPPPASAARARAPPGTPGAGGDAQSPLGTWPGARARGSAGAQALGALSQPTPRPTDGGRERAPTSARACLSTGSSAPRAAPQTGSSWNGTHAPCLGRSGAS